ncbi:MAG TPA: hypothetical protein VI455_18280 [Terriglobia bacterium]
MMKKRITVILSCAAMAGVVWGGSAARPAAPEPLGGQQAGAAKGPQWKSRDEYDAFQKIVSTKDPNQIVAAAEAFIQKYPSSDFKYGAYVAEMQAYQQQGNSAKAIDAAKKALAANPDNIDALTYLSFAFPFTFDPKNPGADAQLTEAQGYAQHGLDVLGKLEKPTNVTDAQFTDYVKPKRAIFNATLGFVALQKKDYATSITSFNLAKQDNPSDPYVFYRLGLAYLSSTPPDFDHAIWNLARAADLAKASKAGDAPAIEKYFGQVYVSRHGSDAGENDVETQAASTGEPPADFKVAAAPKHTSTGNQFVDAFYSYEDALKAGGDTEKTTWDQIKGQQIGGPGFVDNVEAGTDPGSCLVHIDITNDSKAKAGTYDIELKDSQPGCKDLAAGDPLRFTGTLSAYTTTPSFVLTLDSGNINNEDLQAAIDAKKAAAKPKTTRHRATHPTQGC